MARNRTHNFHVPLDEAVYKELRLRAEQQQLPATTLAREAIESWLKQQAKLERSRSIAEFAAQAAGTPDDFDQELEQASIEYLLADQGGIAS